MIQNILNEYVNEWLNNHSIVSLAYLDDLQRDITQSRVSGRKVVFAADKDGICFVFVPTITTRLRALGVAWEDSLERQLVLSHWLERQGLRYVCENYLSLGNEPGDGEVFQKPREDWELPPEFPKVEYLKYRSHYNNGLVLIPKSNLVKVSSRG